MGNRWRSRGRTFVSTTSLPHYAFARHPKNVPHRAPDLAECHPSRPPPPFRKFQTRSKENGYPLAIRVWKHFIFKRRTLQTSHSISLKPSSSHLPATPLAVPCVPSLPPAVIGDARPFRPALSLVQSDDPQSLATPAIPDPLHLR